VSQSLRKRGGVTAAAFFGAGLPDAAGFGAIALIVLLLALGVTALSLGLAFACLVTLINCCNFLLTCRCFCQHCSRSLIIYA